MPDSRKPLRDADLRRFETRTSDVHGTGGVYGSANREYQLVSYLLDEELILRIDEVGRKLVSQSEDEGPGPIKIVYKCLLLDGQTISFPNVGDFVKHAKDKKLVIDRLVIEFENKTYYGLIVDFDKNGLVNINAFGRMPNFEFRLERFMRELEPAEQTVPWFVSKIIVTDMPYTAVKLLIFVCSGMLLYLIGMYFYGLNYGVNIDPQVIDSVPRGMEYYAAVADAIQSDSLNTKLNVLLYRQLNAFVTIDEWLIIQKNRIRIIIICLITLVGMLLTFAKIRSLYPRSLIILGKNSSMLSSLYKKREFWQNAVIVAFVINFLTGMLIAIFT